MTCSAKGDVLNFIQLSEGCSWHEAGKISEKILLSGSMRMDKKRKREKRPVPKSKECKISTDRFQSLLEKILELASLPDEIKNRYLISNESIEFDLNCYDKSIGCFQSEKKKYKSPHFLPETVSKFRIGFLGTKLSDLRKTLNAEGYTDEELLSTGVFDKDKLSRFSIARVFRGRILYPFFREGKVIHLIGRQTEYSATPNKYSNCATHPEVNRTKIFNEDILQSCDQVLITEGVTDCIKANEIGVPSISPVTTQFTHDSYDYLAEKLQGKRIKICFDSEINNSGIKGAYETQKKLAGYGIQSDVIQLVLPLDRDKIDVCDFINEHGCDDFYQLLK